MMTDIEIANSVKPLPIDKIAKKLGIPAENVEPYGAKKAKINYTTLNPQAKLILVSAINPTPAGEGKTTVTIGLPDALNRIGKKTAAALREPSLGPVFGVKGGAAGGGYSQVIPMEEINLHFTGDIHAISTANNLLAALVDNHIHQGNKLRIHLKRILLKRCVDLNDRALRNIIVGMGGPQDGQIRDDGFYITAASEVMAILCLASDINDLKKRLGNILVAYDYDFKPVFAKDLNAENAMAILLKEAIKPNLVQTLEGNPAFIHGGPFANIAHGCNSVIATKTAMTFADYVVTEAGFGADLGAEKFLHIKCRQNDLAPHCVVLVATVKALKNHGCAQGAALTGEKGVEALKKGLCNLERHIKNITQKLKLPTLVAINKFATDTGEELAIIKNACEKLNVKAFDVTVFKDGGLGGEDLAREAVKICENNPSPKINYLYELNDGIKEKIEKICLNYYGSKEVAFSLKALNDIIKITETGFSSLPIIMAKTQYSFSDDARLIGAPEGFTINIREVQLRSGSGFIVAVAGDIMLMPGLPASPASDHMTLNEDGTISGLF